LLSIRPMWGSKTAGLAGKLKTNVKVLTTKLG
jgi:hypothetical protein